jgi:4-hydroxy-2-oxoheptanedioate aldolase
MANTLKQKLAAGRPVLNGWINIASPFAAELMAQGGYDSMTIDMQHGVFDYDTMLGALQALRGTAVTPLVRVAWNEPTGIGRALDAGAMGIICPMIGTADEARQFVKAAKYPLLGQRSNGPIRAGLYSDGPYQATANAETLAIPLIETRQGMENLPAILDVEGVAGVYVGPTDLRLSYGMPIQMDRSDPSFTPILKEYETMISECEKRGLFAGMHTANHDEGMYYIGMGFRMVTISSDSASLLAAARGVVKQFREAVGVR